MSLITDYLNKAKKELLDFGLRNQLINFRLPKARGLILNTPAAEVFSSLIDNDKTVGISGLDEKGEPTLKDGFETNYNEEDLIKRIKKTIRDARSHIEERGINILFLSLGQLEWFEEKDQEKKYKAPLILLPIEIKFNEKTKCFTVTNLDNEFQENTSLKEKLRLEYGIQFPEIKSEDNEFNLIQYFENIKAAIEAQKDWKIDTKSSFISFFNFNKFIMYQDLDESVWLNEQNKEWSDLLKKLLDESFKFNEPKIQIPDEDSLEDHVDASEPTSVLDSDSSQSKAILDVRNGLNLVIQGPPGTGKSQTITNIIADAIRHNKKVLFVAEKNAALDVVARRLKEVNLYEACLELHSHNANKQFLYQELEKVLKLSKPDQIGSKDQIEELKTIASQLTEYTKANNSVIGDTQFTPYMLSAYLAESNDSLNKIDVPSDAESIFENINIEDINKLKLSDFKKYKKYVKEFQDKLIDVGPIKEHPFFGTNIKAALPSEINQLGKAIDKAVIDMTAYRNASEDFRVKLNIKEKLSNSDIDLIVSILKKAPQLDQINFDFADWIDKKAEVKEAIKIIAELQNIERDYKDDLIQDAWKKNLQSERAILNTSGRSMFSIVSSEVRAAKKEVQKLFLNKPPSDNEKLIEIIDLIMDYQKISESLKKFDKTMKSLIGKAWEKNKTDLEQLNIQVDFIFEVINQTQDEKILNIISLLLDQSIKAKVIEDLNDEINNCFDNFKLSIADVKKILAVDDQYFISNGALSYDLVLNKLNLIKANLNRVHDWINLTNNVDNLKLINLGWIFEVAQTWPNCSNTLESYYSRKVIEAKIKEVQKERPVLAKFDPNSQDNLVSRFSKLDLLTQHYRQSEIANIHYLNVKKAVGAAIGEMPIIKTQIQKKRRMAIRKLFQNAGHAVQELKPIIMMSPLSVAAYIPARTLTFDLVIFDEASQVKPVDALGAVLRGNQLVVVGDSKQMPPTNFFESQIIGDEDDDDDFESPLNMSPATSDIESVLSLMVSQNAPERMLRWHYRSQYESLIAVSNYEFYDSRLVLFPNANEDIIEKGLVFNHIKNGIYDRGGSRTNMIEAKAVAMAALNHSLNKPNLTLGIVAFSISQKEAIEDEIEILSKKHEALSNFLEMHGNEKIFIKNLETIQGDERDVIYISVGYGRTKEGFLQMGFGPLNKDGGERRMNVLISRARQTCEVFSSITADEIDLDKTKARGVIVLKSFLRFAKDRILDRVEVPANADYDSEFEEQVAKIIRQNGYDVDPQVGSAGFKIDLAVKNPKLPGAHLLAIECDGATYHSSKSARERDRLRQDVLESRGWRFHRIWSTSWLRDPGNEIKKLLSAIKQAESDFENNKVTIKKILPKVKIERKEDITVDLTVDSNIKPDWIETYVEIEFKINTYGAELADISTTKMAEHLKKIVDVESPIHIDLAARRLTHAAGLTRVGNRINAAVKRACQYGNKNNIFVFDGISLTANNLFDIAIRDRSNVSEYTKDPNLISPIEIVACAKKRCAGAIKPNYSELIPIMCRDFGFKRATAEMKSFFKKTIEAAIKNNKW
jgi:superfamily I DNA and/or RNA helicase/very-short-patch-repair endonuclease